MAWNRTPCDSQPWVETLPLLRSPDPVPGCHSDPVAGPVFVEQRVASLWQRLGRGQGSGAAPAWGQAARRLSCAWWAPGTQMGQTSAMASRSSQRGRKVEGRAPPVSQLSACSYPLTPAVPSEGSPTSLPPALLSTTLGAWKGCLVATCSAGQGCVAGPHLQENFCLSYFPVFVCPQPRVSDAQSHLSTLVPKLPRRNRGGWVGWARPPLRVAGQASPAIRCPKHQVCKPGAPEEQQRLPAPQPAWPPSAPHGRAGFR